MEESKEDVCLFVVFFYPIYGSSKGFFHKSLGLKQDIGCLTPEFDYNLRVRIAYVF